MPVDQWRFQRDGKEEGPVSETDLKRLLAEGILPSSTPVYADYLAQWIPASQVAVFIGSTSADSFDYNSTSLGGDPAPYSVPGFASQSGSVPGWTPEHAFVVDQRSVAGFVSEPHSVPGWGTDSPARPASAPVPAHQAEPAASEYQYHSESEASRLAPRPVLVPNTVSEQPDANERNSQEEPRRIRKAKRKQLTEVELSKREESGMNVDHLRKNSGIPRPWRKETSPDSLVIGLLLAIPVLMIILAFIGWAYR